MKKLKSALAGFILLLSLFSYAQSSVVTGVVKDERGQPLNGVSITVKGTNNGTTTDALGTFSLNVPTEKQFLFLPMWVMIQKK